MPTRERSKIHQELRFTSFYMIQMLERDALKVWTINSLISTTLFDPPKMTIIAHHFPGVNAVQGAVGCAADPRNSEGKQGTAGG